MKKICFVGLDNYPVLNPAYGRFYFGGEQIQQTILAREFFRQGYDVHMIVHDYGQVDGERIDGIKVWKTFKADAGIPILKFFHPRLSSIVRALARADADVYYQSSAGMLTGITAFYCKQRKRKFVFRIASDLDCFPEQLLIKLWRDKKLYEYGLKNADLVLAQTSRQVDLMALNYGVRCGIANMLVEKTEATVKGRKIDILWVNNFRPVKKPYRVLDLARMLPDLSFAMVGGPCPGEEALYCDIKSQADNMPNVNFMGFVPYHEARPLFSQARVLLSTSDWEGFPNTYLQAWMAGIPVIAFFDPSDIVQKERIGIIVSSIEKAAESLLILCNNEAMRYKLGGRAKTYSEQHHGQGAISQYMKFIENLVEDRQQGLAV